MKYWKPLKLTGFRLGFLFHGIAALSSIYILLTSFLLLAHSPVYFPENSSSLSNHQTKCKRHKDSLSVFFCFPLICHMQINTFDFIVCTIPPQLSVLHNSLWCKFLARFGPFALLHKYSFSSPWSQTWIFFLPFCLCTVKERQFTATEMLWYCAQN